MTLAPEELLDDAPLAAPACPQCLQPRDVLVATSVMNLSRCTNDNCPRAWTQYINAKSLREFVSVSSHRNAGKGRRARRARRNQRRWPARWTQ